MALQKFRCTVQSIIAIKQIPGHCEDLSYEHFKLQVSLNHSISINVSLREKNFPLIQCYSDQLSVCAYYFFWWLILIKPLSRNIDFICSNLLNIQLVFSMLKNWNQRGLQNFSYWNYPVSGQEFLKTRVRICILDCDK